MSMSRVPVLMMVSLLCLAQLGCGFRLRGAVDIPDTLNPIFIQANAGSAVRAAMLGQLAGGQVRVTDDVQEAKLIVRLLTERTDSRVAALDSRGGILAYELIYRVGYDAIAPDGTQVIPVQSFELVRNFDNPDVEVLGKQLEEALIFQDFARDAADRILMRLRMALL